MLTLEILYAVKANCCKKSNMCKSEAGHSHTDTESCSSNTSNINRKKAIPPNAVYLDSVQEGPANKSNSNMRPDLMNIYSDILNPL